MNQPTDAPQPTNTAEPRPQYFKTAWEDSYPDMHKVVVQNVTYRTVDDTSLTMDVYYPPDMKADERLPVVIFVFGYTDSAAKRLVGSALKDYSQYTSWGRLTAASGLIALTYQTQQPDDLEALVEYTRKNAASMNIDADRSASGHARPMDPRLCLSLCSRAGSISSARCAITPTC